MTELQEVSLFSGIGGISLGLERAGARTALLCEYDKHARNILGRHYPDAAIHNDVTELTADDCRAAGAVPGRSIVSAGWPCQGNSVAGRRGGMDDPRSGLWSHVVRLLAEFRPAWFIGENVPGLLSVNDGRDFSIVVHDLARLGYGFTWRVLDARHFGVPQRRRRVVIVGRLGDTGAAATQVLLEPEGVRGDPAAGITPRAGASRPAREGAAVGFSHTAGIDLQASADVYPTMKAGHNTMPSVVYAATEVSTLQAAGGERGYRIDAEAAAGGHLVAFAENQRGELVTSALLDGTVVRRLTPLECERLQGFPDGWTDNGQADTHRSKQLGNSVAVPVFEWIGRRLVAVDGVVA